ERPSTASSYGSTQRLQPGAVPVNRTMRWRSSPWPPREPSRLLEDPPPPEDGPPPAVKADAGSGQNRSHERVEDHAEPELRVDVGVLVRIERGAVFEPAGEEYRTSHEIRQSTDLAHGTDGRDRVMVSASLAPTERVQDVGIAKRELTRRQRLVVE